MTRLEKIAQLAAKIENLGPENTLSTAQNIAANIRKYSEMTDAEFVLRVSMQDPRFRSEVKRYIASLEA